MTRLTLMVLAALLAACTGNTMLRHPTTGAVVECSRGANACVDRHLRDGFSCVAGDCWESAPAGSGSVFIQRTPK